MRMLKLVIVVLFFAAFSFAGPTTAPNLTYTLGENKFEYQFSSNWNFSPKNNKDDAAIFVREEKQGQSQINLLPKGADLSDNIAVGILKKIREERKKSGAKVIKDAKIEKDKRFNIRIYEEFEYNGHVFAQLHLFFNRLLNDAAKYTHAAPVDRTFADLQLFFNDRNCSLPFTRRF